MFVDECDFEWILFLAVEIEMLFPEGSFFGFEFGFFGEVEYLLIVGKSFDLGDDDGASLR